MLRAHFFTALRSGSGRSHRSGASFSWWAKGIFFAHRALLLMEKSNGCLQPCGVQRFTVIGFFLRFGLPHGDAVGSVHQARPLSPPFSWSTPQILANITIQLLLHVHISRSHAHSTRSFRVQGPSFKELLQRAPGVLVWFCLHLHMHWLPHHPNDMWGIIFMAVVCW